MIKPTVERIIEVMNNKGFKVYDNPDIEWNVKII